MEEAERPGGWYPVFDASVAIYSEQGPGADLSAVVWQDGCYAFGRGEWHRLIDMKGDIPSSVVGHSAIVVNEKMFIHGGQTNEDDPTKKEQTSSNNIHAFHFASNSWERIHEEGNIRPSSRFSNHSCVHHHDDALYFFGGISSIFYRFLLKEHRWESVRSTGWIPWRQDHVAVVYNGFMWVVGGMRDSKYLNDVHRFDLATNRWERVTVGGTKPQPRSGHTAVLYHHYLVLSGGSDSETFFDDLWLLDLDRLVWVQVVTQSSSSTPPEDKEKEKERKEQKSEREHRGKEQYRPVGRRDHAAVVYSSHMYIIGGKGQASYPNDYICAFDLRTLPIFHASDPTKTLLLSSSGGIRWGHVYTCGYGSHGQLGHGLVTVSKSPIPIRVQTLGKVVKVASGGVHSVAMTEDGRLYQWGGSNETARRRLFGNPNLSPRKSSVPQPPRYVVRDVACSVLHTMAVLDDAKTGSSVTYQWGYDPSDPSKPATPPQEIISLSASKVAKVAASGLSTLLLTHNDEVFSWSIENLSQLRLIDIPERIAISQVACGADHTLLLTHAGRIFGSGSNRFGQCGRQEPPSIDESLLIDGATGVIMIGCGDNHSLYICHDGSLFSFGQGKCGQLGLGHRDNVSTPAQIHALQHLRIKFITGGGGLDCSHSIAVSEEGVCYAWGSNKYGQLGIETEAEEVLLPQVVSALEDKIVLSASCGWLHSAFLVADSTLKPGASSRRAADHTEYGLFECLPNETLQLIFFLLTAKDVCFLGQTNTTFKLYCDDDELWRGFIEERWADKLSPYHREIIQHLHGNEKKTFKEIFAFIAKKHDSNPGAALFSSAEKKRGEKSWLPSFPNIGRMLGTRNEKRIFMLGLDGAGKTSILYMVKLGEVVETVPTIGFNVETVTRRQVKLCIWDCGGSAKIRPLYRHYYGNNQGLILVIDSTDRERLDECQEEIRRCLQEEMYDPPVLVFANKQDKADALSVAELKDFLSLEACLQGRKWQIFPCCVYEGKRSQP